MAIDPKELKRLAKACREAGIKSYSADGISFTLTEEAPAPSAYKRRKATKEATEDPGEQEISTDGWDALSEEQQLFYSASPLVSESNDPEKAN